MLNKPMAAVPTTAPTIQSGIRPVVPISDMNLFPKLIQYISLLIQMSVIIKNKNQLPNRAYYYCRLRGTTAQVGRSSAYLLRKL
jgi:hypothetical protein